MDHTALERILRLIGLLIGNRRTTQELSEILECDLRTVQRYIQLLKTAGFLIEYHCRGVPFLSGRKGRLKDISNLVHFNEEEAFILRKAIDSISGETQLKQNLRKKLYSIYNFPDIVEIVVKPELGETVHRLIEAINTKKTVRLKGYQSANSNTISDRIVEPYQFTTNYSQIWCFDLKNNKCKLFTTARIQAVEETDLPWRNKLSHTVAGVDVFRNSGFKPVGWVKLQLNIRATSLLKEEYPLAEQYLKTGSDQHIVFDCPVNNFEGPARFVLGMFENIAVLGDESFIRFLNKKILSMKNINDGISR